MRKSFGREIALLSLPVLIIGAVAWRKNRGGPPEDVWSGKARLLTQVRHLDVAPFDIYRGYTHKIAIDQWAAGALPPTPAPRAGAIRSYRQVEPRYSPLYVAFRQGKTWKRTLSVSERGVKYRDPSLKIAAVTPDVASLRMESIDNVGQDRGMFTTTYSLRLPASPRLEEAFLCGRTNAEIQDRDVKMIAGVRTDDIVKTRPIASNPMRWQLQNLNDATSYAVRSQVAPWKVEEALFLPPSAGSNYLHIDLTLTRVANDAQAGRVRMQSPRLLDARGKNVGKLNSYGSGGGRPIPADAIGAHLLFDFSTRAWKTAARPLTLQAAISVDNGWPEEVNILLERPNTEMPVKASKLRFLREPLPLR